MREELSGLYNYGWELKRAFVAGAINATYGKQLEELTRETEIKLKHTEDGIELDATREELTKLLLLFGGDWEKTISMWDDAKFNYSQVVELGTERYKICITTDPPPSCQIVEELVVVPEHTVVRRKAVCSEPSTIANQQAVVTPEQDTINP